MTGAEKKSVASKKRLAVLSGFDLRARARGESLKREAESHDAPCHPLIKAGELPNEGEGEATVVLVKDGIQTWEGEPASRLPPCVASYQTGCIHGSA